MNDTHHRSSMVTAYVSIGNSDDKLTQREWSDFVGRVSAAIQEAAQEVHGAWYSEPAARWQNACWCAEFTTDRAAALKRDLAWLAKAYRQDSIAWAAAPQVELLCAG